MRLFRSISFRLAVAWRNGLWMLPALIVAFGVVLAALLVFIDPDMTGLQAFAPRVFTVSADGARGVLTAIATSMLSVAGLVFSITITTLALTSQQFTSRVLRTFVRDRGNQVVLGVFLGVFAYCLVVLRAVRSPYSGAGYVPELALLVGIGLAFVGVGFLIYFIDHVARSIQASAIISRVAAETMRVLRAGGQPPEEPAPHAVRTERDAASSVLDAAGEGYVGEIDALSLGKLAAERGWRIRMLVTVGHFVVAGDDLLCVSSDDGEPPAIGEHDAATLRKAISQGPTGEIEADPGFGIRQLVDIALKALSPGINDVTTALNCVDYLGAVLLVASEHASPYVIWSDDHGEARVVVLTRGFPDLLREALDQIRENGAAQFVVLLRLLGVLSRLAEHTHDAARREHLRAHVGKIEEAARRRLSAPAEADLVGSRAAELLVRLSSAVTGA